MEFSKKCLLLGCDYLVFGHGNSKYCSEECRQEAKRQQSATSYELLSLASSATKTNQRLFRILFEDLMDSETITIDHFEALRFGFEHTGYILEEEKEDNLFFYLNDYVFFYSTFGTTTQLNIKKHSL